jgi:hypothetical protein
MSPQTSAAGPFKFRLSELHGSTLDVGETVVVNTRSLNGGPRNKQGGLTKYYGRRGGFDFVQVVNSTAEILEANADGAVAQDVPPSTSINISGVGPQIEAESQVTSYTRVAVTNTGIATSGGVATEEITVAFGNQPRPEESQQAGIAFDPLEFVPGVVRNG